jgi:hypothetical protein
MIPDDLKKRSNLARIDDPKSVSYYHPCFASRIAGDRATPTEAVLYCLPFPHRLARIVFAKGRHKMLTGLL